MTDSDERVVHGTYISFKKMVSDPSRKTNVWNVVERQSLNYIGTVKWFTRWRKYAYFPDGGTVYEEVCLREIAAFIEARTKEHKDERQKDVVSGR